MPSLQKVVSTYKLLQFIQFPFCFLCLCLSVTRSLAYIGPCFRLYHTEKDYTSEIIKIARHSVKTIQKNVQHVQKDVQHV